ncbi:MAG: ABC transporter substrate-binding protein [Gaiellaceae bacterium]
MRKLLFLLVLVAALGALAAGCGGAKKSAGKTTGGNSCAKANLQLLTAGKLTIGTDNPAYPPWYGGTAKPPWKTSDPRSGQGFESAVAYAVAGKLGFAKGAVKWVAVPFDQLIKPGSKSFDFDINQVSYSADRAKAVDFSNSYYEVNQALVARKGTPIASATSVAGLKKYKLGVQIGTTSYSYVVKNIKPDKKPSVYSNSNDVVSALKAKGIDGIVVDFPTAYYISVAQVPNSTVVGRLPTVGPHEHFGLVFQKGSSLVGCVNKALQSLKQDGTLARLEQEWISSKAHAPLLK